MSNDIVNYPRQGAQQAGSAFTTSARGVDAPPEQPLGRTDVVPVLSVDVPGFVSGRHRHP